MQASGRRGGRHGERSKADRYFEAGQPIADGHGNRGAVLFGYLLDDRKSEAATGQFVSQTSIKAVEHTIPVLARNSRPAVLDRQKNLFGIAHDLHVYPTGGGRVADRIVD